MSDGEKPPLTEGALVKEDEKTPPTLEKPRQNPNHPGTLDKNRYPACEKIFMPLTDLSEGDDCPECGSNGPSAKLRKVPPGKFIQFQGQPIIGAIFYELERVQCQLCGAYFSAALPELVQKQGRYSPRCVGSLAFHHYYMGAPLKRIETAQRLMRLPFPDATAWDRLNQLYPVIEPVYEVLLDIAPEGNEFDL